MISFYLGGSRRMAEKYPDLIKITNPLTDWDYNVQHCDEASKLLNVLGTKTTGNPLYNDNQAVEFYSLANNVTVVTRKNLNVYSAAFEMVRPEEYLKYHWKSSPFLVDPFDRNRAREFFNKLFEYAENKDAAKGGSDALL